MIWKNHATRPEGLTTETEGKLISPHMAADKVTSTVPEKCITMKELESYTEESSWPAEPLQGSSCARLMPELPRVHFQAWYILFPSFTLDWSRVSDIAPKDWSLSFSRGSPACSGGPKAPPLVSCLRATTEGGFPPARASYRTSWCFCQIELQPPVHCLLPIIPHAAPSEVACQPCGSVTPPPCRWIFP